MSQSKCLQSNMKLTYHSISSWILRVIEIIPTFSVNSADDIGEMGELVEQCSFFTVIALEIWGSPEFSTEIDCVIVNVIWVDICESAHTGVTRASVLFVHDPDIWLQFIEHFLAAFYEIATWWDWWNGFEGNSIRIGAGYLTIFHRYWCSTFVF